MSLSLRCRIVFALVMSLLPICGQAADLPELYSRLREYTVSYTLAPDATFKEERRIARTVLHEKAVTWFKEGTITYSTSLQTAEVIEAYTHKADGRRVVVPPNNFQIVARSGRGGASPAFSDWTTMTVIFPDVAAGDTTVLAYRLVAKAPLFPGHFSAIETFGRSEAMDDVRVRFDLPASLAVRHEARSMTEVRNVEEAGRRIVELAWKNPDPPRSKRRDFSAYDFDSEPGYSLSTFKDYAAIAAAYGERARPKAAVTERIRKLADEIAPGSAPARETARKLYDWVAANISYAGNCIGLGAVVPRDVDFVLDNRMGDCKDQATLLQALLAAKGIVSTQALVNSGSSYRLPRIPVVAMVNHVINYIPSLDLYLDPTSESTPFGMLPFSVAGKPVLLVDGYRDGTKTPVLPVDSNRQVMRTRMTINDDGSITGEVSVSLNGAFAASARERFRALPKEQEAQFVANVFRSSGHVGSGTFTRDDPKALLDSFEYSAKFEVKGMVAYPGTGAFPLAPVFYSEAPVFRYASHAFLEVEETEVACSSGRSLEEYVIQLPKAMKVLAIPGDMKLYNDFLAYRASYVHEGSTLRVTRSFEDRTPGNLCQPAMMQAYKEFAQKIVPNLRSQVVYQ
jgi:transglutaminase-like putative cysteine protease